MMNVDTRGAARPVTWRLWVAPFVWAVHFLAIYAFTALACERMGTAGWFGVEAVLWFVGAATLAAVAVLLVTIVVAVRDGRKAATLPEVSPFVHWLTAAIAGLGLLAVLWETLPVLLVPVCS